MSFFSPADPQRENRRAAAFLGYSQEGRLRPRQIREGEQGAVFLTRRTMSSAEIATPVLKTMKTTCRIRLLYKRLRFADDFVCVVWLT